MHVFGQKFLTSIKLTALTALAVSLALIAPTAACADPQTAPPQQVSPSVTWLTSLSAARAAAQKSGKNVFVDYSATWCGPCQAMIHDTFPNPEVAPLLKKFVCVRIDIDQDQNDALKYNVNAIPRLLLLPPNSTTPRMDVTGYQDSDTFANSLRTALGMPQLPGQDVMATPVVTSAAAQVAQALSDNSYRDLKSKNPQVTEQGLVDLVDQLSEPPESEVIPLSAELLSKAGKDADNALIGALSSKLLAERVGAFSMFKHLHPTTAIKFDPWASSPLRKSEIAAWTISKK